MVKYISFLCSLVFFASCNNNSETNENDFAYEFVKVDSLVMDILEPVHILDYHHEKELYLIVKQASLEGHYYVINKAGEILAENQLSEGPDAFGMVLLRAGFVGDEIAFLSEGKAFLYDLNLKPLRKLTFEQNPRVRLIHFSLDNLSTFRSPSGSLQLVANLNDGNLQRYPEDYFDTLNLVHLLDVGSGDVSKGGKLDEGSMFRSGKFFPFIDKPVFFSDYRSSLVSVILQGDSVLYQVDPNENFKTVNKLGLPRFSPDEITSIPISEASGARVRELVGDNVLLAGAFDEMMGFGNEVLVGYRTGDDLEIAALNEGIEDMTDFKNPKKHYYYFINEGKLQGKAIPWTEPGRLKLNVGPGRYLQYGDQAELHEYEKDYQCYYIYELREKE